MSMSISNLLNPDEIRSKQAPAVPYRQSFRRNNRSGFINAVFYGNWRIRNHPQESPGSLDYRCIDRVYYAYANVDKDGTVTLGDEYVDTQMQVDGTNGCLASLLAKRTEYPHLQVILSIGGSMTDEKLQENNQENFFHVVRHNARIDRFVETTMHLVRTYGLDGIDVCWESPGSHANGRKYVELLIALRQYLPLGEKILTISIPGTKDDLDCIPLDSAAEHVDTFNVMCYDFYGGWSRHCGHQSQFGGHVQHVGPEEHSCVTVMRYLRAQRTPSKKLLLGIPAYGWSFPNARHLFDVNSGVNKTRRIDYRDICNLSTVDPENKEFFDNEAGAAYRSGGNAGFVTYDDAGTVTMKADFVRNHGLAGLFYFTGTQDCSSTGTSHNSLIYNGYQSLLDQF